ncbi:MAG: ABC transporter permease subunit [Phycisphaerales bacterium]|nr:ABC transporter permease subunit [Phycisphaerales bacterium]
MSDAQSNDSVRDGAPSSISGIEAMRGVGALQAKGFWADAWDRVVVRVGAKIALTWICVIAFFALFAPVIANAHPILRTNLKTGVTDSPLWTNLTSVDLALLCAGFFALPWIYLSTGLASKCGVKQRSTRLGMLLLIAMQAGATIVVCGGISAWSRDTDGEPWIRNLASMSMFPLLSSALVGIVIAGIALVAASGSKAPAKTRTVLILCAACIAIFSSSSRWTDRLVNFDVYDEQEASGECSMIYTLIPFSPNYGRSDLYVLEPMTNIGEAVPELADRGVGSRTMLLGSDALGKDVLAQMLWACRLSISIGLLSTGIAVTIGVTLGALMGYFGGWVDLLLYRVVEIFMAIPVLFLLIVAAAVLPRNTYVMMAIIGCVSWTGAARFTRAEFLKLRKQDFVQGAQAAGLPLRSVLFKHMLPNGVTPVLVDASFAVAAAIIAEATLSYLGLGPDGQASWGKLLSSATGTTGTFVWWLAIFPGFAIFFTVLSYNVLGEAMRDAIDPKLRKAAH